MMETILSCLGVPWKIVLTKCDLLSTVEVAQSMAIIETDLIKLLTKSTSTKTYSSSSMNAMDQDKQQVDNQSKIEIKTDIVSPEESLIRHNNTSNSNFEHSVVSSAHQINDERNRTNDNDADGDTSHSSTNIYTDEDDFIKNEECITMEVSQEIILSNDNTNEISKNMNLTDNIINKDPKVDLIDVNSKLHEDHETAADDDNNDDDSVSMDNRIIPVSSSTGAGIKQLWQILKNIAYLNTFPPSRKNEAVMMMKDYDPYDVRVREHYNANLLRRLKYKGDDESIRSVNKLTPKKLVKGYHFSMK